MTTQFLFSPNLALQAQFPEFAGLTIYGTIYEPLFIVDQVKTLGQFHISNLARDFKLGDEYIKIKTIAKDCKIREQNVFTLAGLYRVMFKSTTEVALKFQRFMTLVMNELRLMGYAEVNEITEKFKKLEEDNKKKTEFINTLEIQLDEEHEKALKAQKDAEKHMFKHYEIWSKYAELKDEMKKYNGRHSQSDRYFLEILREKFMMPVKICRIPKPACYRQAGETEECEKDLAEIYPGDDEDFYFTVEHDDSSNFHVGRVYIYKEIGEEGFRRFLRSRAFEPMRQKNIFFGSMEAINQVVDDLMTMKLEDYYLKGIDQSSAKGIDQSSSKVSAPSTSIPQSKPSGRRGRLPMPDAFRE
jgi:prophage antirepressor-like protein